MQEDVEIGQIGAVMLGVRDLPQAVAFYRDKLGLGVIMQENQLALLRCGSVMLGLSRGHVAAAPQVTGATEVVFQVKNVKATYQALKSRGVEFISPPRQATPTDWVANFRDVDGHLLSVFGPEGHA